MFCVTAHFRIAEAELPLVIRFFLLPRLKVQMRFRFNSNFYLVGSRARLGYTSEDPAWGAKMEERVKGNHLL